MAMAASVTRATLCKTSQQRTSSGFNPCMFCISSSRIHLSVSKTRAFQPLRVTRAQSSGSEFRQTQVPVDEERENAKKSLQELAETLVLPAGFLSKLPDDLKVDLKDAAFALSSGPLNQECGERVGELVMRLSRAWEQADTKTAGALALEVPSLLDMLPSDPFSNAALGKRLQAAGRYLALTGQYGNGELQKLSKALVAAGEALSSGSPSLEDKAPPKGSPPIFKFGDLQVQLTSQKAYIGAAISIVFGLLSWELTSTFQGTAISQKQYANENSLVLATSLQGTLLAAGYFCAVLSAITAVGLLVLASQLGQEDTS